MRGATPACPTGLKWSNPGQARKGTRLGGSTPPTPGGAAIVLEQTENESSGWEQRPLALLFLGLCCKL